MQISSSLPSLAAPRSPGPRPAGGNVPYDVAQARAESAAEKRRAEDIEAQNAEGIASFARQGFKMTQGSYLGLYKQDLARSIDTDSDGAIGVQELASKLGGDQDLERAGRLHQMLDIDGDGSVGLSEFGDSVRDPFRDTGFRKQLDGRGAMDPSGISALYRQQAARHDAGTVLGSMARAIDTVA